MKLVTAYVSFRSSKRKRHQQWEGFSKANMKLEGIAAELQKVKGQL
jgi:hypothetical protein